MSQPFYDWLREEGFKILGVTVEEQKAVETRKDIFCSLATSEIEKHAGKVPQPMELFDRMPREQKIGFCEVVIQDGLILLGLRKKKQVIEEEEEQLQQVRLMKT